jgi:carnitine O-acetyltransferase
MNRWYDKSLSIIVCQNGAAGINFEHSVIDGHSVLRFASDVFTDTILTFAENIRKGFQASKSTGPKSSGVGVGGGAAAGDGEGQGAATRVWERIVWDIDAETSNAIRKAEAKVKPRALDNGV